VNIPYTYLAVLLVFTLLIGVVIGDRLAHGNGIPLPDDGDGRSGGCSGLASGRLHECVHRHGYLRTAARKSARSGAAGWPDSRDNGDLSCELPGGSQDDE
jgi:hypothetical protein